MKEVVTNFKTTTPWTVGTWRKAQTAVRKHSGGQCEAGVPLVCTGRGEHVHHMVLRSRGGTHDPELLKDCCLACHGWIHANPTEATERGLMRHSWEDR